MDNSTINTIAGAFVGIALGDSLSKVCGRRNWGVRIESKKKTAVVGGYGVMCRRHLMGGYLWEFAEYGLKLVDFTYKKDCMELIQKLEAAGYKICWI